MEYRNPKCYNCHCNRRAYLRLNPTQAEACRLCGKERISYLDIQDFFSSPVEVCDGCDEILPPHPLAKKNRNQQRMQMNIEYLKTGLALFALVMGILILWFAIAGIE